MADLVILNDLKRVFFFYQNILNNDYYVIILSNYVPEESVIHKEWALCQKTRFK